MQNAANPPLQGLAGGLRTLPPAGLGDATNMPPLQGLVSLL
ncbi:hypothetical protein [Desulfonema magnum]|uniref:Uncharacterized protein n=1 Tax=Desulfonema magnum TaxID=45655 RepID=A0A975GSK2_9BACT|nr:hypothetical protein [Desulfonema magnum]QTA92156.1 Uncharacterized protein dnm_082320 [Desulfonema magnum]